MTVVPGAGQRVDAAAGHPRPDVGPPLLGGGAELAVDVDDRDADGAQRVHRVGEVGVVAGADAVATASAPGPGRDDVGERAHGEADVPRIAGEQVAPARAAAGEQAAAVGVPALDLDGVGGVGDPGDVVAVLLVPAEPEDVVVGALQDRADAGAGLRAPVGVPGGQHVAARPQPGGQGGHRPVADGAAGGLVGQPVDLQEQHPGRARLRIAAVAGAAADAAEEDLVLVDRERAVDQRRRPPTSPPPPRPRCRSWSPRRRGSP